MIVCRDYSLRKRLETTPSTKSAPIGKKKNNLLGREKDADQEPEEPKLQCLQVDITDPLSKDEWQNFLEVINATNGLGWF